MACIRDALSNVTDSDIESLMVDAEGVGDSTLVDTCLRALDGDREALDDVAYVLMGAHER